VETPKWIDVVNPTTFEIGWTLDHRSQGCSMVYETIILCSGFIEGSIAIAFGLGKPKAD